MRVIYQLLQLRFLSPFALLLLFRAKRKHGNNLCFLLKFAADYYGNKIAVSDGSRKLSFIQLYHQVLSSSFEIDKKIASHKDCTAILICNNSIDYIITLYAIQNLGIRLILIHHKTLANEIHTITAKLNGPYYLFTSELLDEFADNTILINELQTAADNKTAGLYSKNFARVIFTTSGTTGESKLIEKRQGEFYWLHSFADLIQKTAIDKRHCVYIAVPVSHGFGYTALLFTLVLGKKALLSFTKDQAAITSLLLQQQADLLVGVPAVLNQLSENLSGKAHAVHTVISGGAPLNQLIFKNITTAISKNIFSLYGSTEASTSFMADYSQLSQNCCALGSPLKGIAYKLEAQPTGSSELLIRSSLSNTVAQNGWLHTGDIVQQDAKGNIVWCCRKDNMILKNGVNIYPAEIEQQLLNIEGIEDVLVSAEKDNIKGECITAFVKMKAGIDFDAQQIKEKLHLLLPGIKIPDTIYATENFEYTGSGKKISRRFR